MNDKGFFHGKHLRNLPEILALRKTFGLDGYATYCMLLEMSGEKIDGDAALDFEDHNKEVIASDIGITIEKLDSIIDYLCRIKKAELQNGILLIY